MFRIVVTRRATWNAHAGSGTARRAKRQTAADSPTKTARLPKPNGQLPKTMHVTRDATPSGVAFPFPMSAIAAVQPTMTLQLVARRSNGGYATIPIRVNVGP